MLLCYFCCCWSFLLLLLVLAVVGRSCCHYSYSLSFLPPPYSYRCFLVITNQKMSGQ